MRTELPSDLLNRDPIDFNYVPEDPGPHVGDTVINEQGAGQSFTGTRADLLDGRAMKRLTEILHVGAEKYGANAWHRIPGKDHINHALTHLFAGLESGFYWYSGMKEEDHLAHAFTRLMFALGLRERRTEGRTECTNHPAPPSPKASPFPATRIPVVHTMDEFVKGQKSTPDPVEQTDQYRVLYATLHRLINKKGLSGIERDLDELLQIHEQGGIV